MGNDTTQLTFGEPEQLEFPFVETKPAAIIGLMGRRGSGKDTIAKAAQKLDDSVVRLAFGDGVKHEVAEVIGHSHVFLDEHKEQLRPLLQAWGTEYRRNLCDPHHWIKSLANRLNGVDSESIVLITDVRFQNEVDFIREQGGVVVRVVRDRDKYEPVDFHPSEANIDSIKPDAQFLNNGPTPEAMTKGVERLIEWALDPTRMDTLPSEQSEN